MPDWKSPGSFQGWPLREIAAWRIKRVGKAASGRLRGLPAKTSTPRAQFFAASHEDLSWLITCGIIETGPTQPHFPVKGGTSRREEPEDERSPQPLATRSQPAGDTCDALPDVLAEDCPDLGDLAPADSDPALPGPSRCPQPL